VATLSRDELSLLAVFLVVPMVLLAPSLGWGRRIGLLAVAGLTVLLLVGPWVGYNMSRFHDPVYVSSGFGVTLASANCAQLYQGPTEGYWSLECAVLAKDTFTPGADESVQGAEAQAYAMRFVRHHEHRLLPVELAREGRAFGLFHPLEQIRLDSTVETRPYRWALVGLGMYYAMVALSVGGLVLLRRRRIPVLPLLAVVLDVVVSVALTFGQTRYRTTAEVSLVMASAVQLEPPPSVVVRRRHHPPARPDGRATGRPHRRPGRHGRVGGSTRRRGQPLTCGAVPGRAVAARR
jgi:hypothetical protein